MIWYFLLGLPCSGTIMWEFSHTWEPYKAYMHSNAHWVVIYLFFAKWVVILKTCKKFRLLNTASGPRHHHIYYRKQKTYKLLNKGITWEMRTMLQNYLGALYLWRHHCVIITHWFWNLHRHKVSSAFFVPYLRPKSPSCMYQVSHLTHGPCFGQPQHCSFPHPCLP